VVWSVDGLPTSTITTAKSDVLVHLPTTDMSCPFVISCPNICNYCSHNTNKATGVGCGCRDDCTASDDDVVTAGW
jgi:hypothetical protein